MPKPSFDAMAACAAAASRSGSSPVQQLDFNLPALELLSIGPNWLRGWETPFFLTLVAVSILIKVVFRIE